MLYRINIEPQITRLIFLLLCFAPIVVIGQPPLDRQVVVTRDFEPIIQNSNKINIQPEIVDTVQITPGFNYRVFPIPAKTTYEVKPIKPAKLVGIPVSEIYNYHIIGGLGNRHIPFVEFYANNLRSDKYLVGMSANLKNIEGNVKLSDGNKVNASNRNFSVMGYGKKFMNKVNIEGDVGADMNKVYRYGLNFNLNPILFIPETKLLKYNYQTLFAHGKIYSTKIDQLYTYSLEVNEDFTSDNEEFHENDFSIEMFNKAKLSTFDFHFDAEVNLLNNNLNADSSLDKTIISFSPYLNNRSGDFRYKLGLTFTFETVGGVTNTYVYPKAGLEYSVAGSILTTYFGLEGKLYANSYKDILDKNPFVEPGISVLSSDNKLKAFAGVKGDISKRLSYYVIGEIMNIGNYILFVNSPDSIDINNMSFHYDNYFTIQYDDMDIVKIGGGINYTIKKKLELTMDFSKNNYLVSTQDQPWHLPLWNYNMSVVYNIQNKITLSGDLNIVGTRKALNIRSGEVIELDPFAVLDIKLDYHFSKALSAFIVAKNLNGAEYEIWNQYPYFKTMIIVGVSYKF